MLEITHKQYMSLKFLLFMQNEADVVLAENALLKKTCEAAEEGQEDLKKKSAMTEVSKLFHFLTVDIVGWGELGTL